MKKRLKILPRDRFDGKSFVLSPTDGVDAYADIAEDFMSRIFDIPTGEYLITDESDLLDFTPFDESDTSSIWKVIRETYGLEEADVGSARLLAIFRAIASRKSVQ